MTETQTKVASTVSRGTWTRIGVAVFFGLFYAYGLWRAIGTAVQLPSYYVAIGLRASEVPWWLLILTIAAPVIVFVLALVVARRRSIWQVVLILLVGLAVFAAVSLSLIDLEGVLRPIS
jgi:hypothetical protein